MAWFDTGVFLPPSNRASNAYTHTHLLTTRLRKVHMTRLTRLYHSIERASCHQVAGLGLEGTDSRTRRHHNQDYFGIDTIRSSFHLVTLESSVGNIFSPLLRSPSRGPRGPRSFIREVFSLLNRLGRFMHSQRSHTRNRLDDRRKDFNMSSSVRYG